MSARTIVLDGPTEAVLLELSRKEQIAPDDLAARLLRRAIRAARPRPLYDIEALRAYAQEYAEEDLALADSDSQHRADLLAAEDAA